MRSTRRKTPRVLAFGMAFLVLTICLVTEAANVVFAAPLPALSPKAPATFTPGAANTAVTTYKQDNGHTGNQANETTLNTSNVNANTFGEKVSYPVDGQVYAQPLFVPNLTINGTPHNVVFVATENDSLYAFDADQTSPVAPLWHKSYLGTNIIAASNIDINCNDMIPKNGLSGTPVIDTSTNTMYVVVQTEDISGGQPGPFTYKLHAVDITTGQDKPGSPTTITASVSGSGVGGNGSTINFNPATERQRAGLIFSQGKVYIAFGSYCDHNPYHGWVMSYSYDGSAFKQLHVFNTTRNGTRGGVWGGGGALVADSTGNVYFVSGNGSFNGTSDFGDSFVKLDQNLKELDYFSPFNQACLDSEDADLGSGGPLVVPGQNRLLGAGKEGRIYVLDTNSMGHYTNPYSGTAFCASQQGSTTIDKVVEELAPKTIKGLYTSAAYWQTAGGQQYIYYAGSNDNMKAFSFSGGLISKTPFSTGTDTYSFTGGNPTISSNNGAAGTGIVWALAPQPKPSTGAQTAVLFAYDALSMNKIYSSQTNSSRDGLGSYVKFSAPTVANGEVFVATQSSLVIYGLLAGSSSGTPTGSPTPTGPSTAYNNTGISYDDHTTAARFDTNGNSYSASALTNDGVLQNGQVTGAGFLFRWPDATPGAPDNWVANGEVISVTPVANADHLGFLGSATNGTSSGQVTLTYTDGTTQTVMLTFNDWAAKSVTKLLPGETVIASMPYRNTPAGPQTMTMNLYTYSVALQAGKTLKSVQLPSLVTGGQLHVFALATSSLSSPIYNSVCIQQDGGIHPGSNSDNGNLSPPSCDTGAYAFSATALQQAGLIPGYSFATNNFLFNWPNAPANESDNFQANGQTVSVTPVSKADTLGFLGMATNGATSGTATINYTDGTSNQITLGFTDWASATLSFGNTVAVKMTYRDLADGSKQTKNMYLFVATAPLDTTKTVASVTLPATVTGGQLHVFDIETRSATAPIYNNAGISDDTAVYAGNFDGGGRTYSSGALTQVGVNAGDNAFDPTRVVRFEWPTPLSGQPDNYQCTGQVIPVDNPQTNSTVLGFLGASANGAASGTITVTYTDGTSTQFTLGFDDWTLGGGKVTKLSYTNEAISYKLAYRNTRAGADKTLTYVFYNYVSIDPTKTVASVTLPSTTTGTGQMHIFAIAAAAL